MYLLLTNYQYITDDDNESQFLYHQICVQLFHGMTYASSLETSMHLERNMLHFIFLFNQDEMGQIERYISMTQYFEIYICKGMK